MRMLANHVAAEKEGLFRRLKQAEELGGRRKRKGGRDLVRSGKEISFEALMKFRLFPKGLLIKRRRKVGRKVERTKVPLFKDLSIDFKCECHRRKYLLRERHDSVSRLYPFSSFAFAVRSSYVTWGTLLGISENRYITSEPRRERWKRIDFFLHVLRGGAGGGAVGHLSFLGKLRPFISRGAANI